MKYEKIPTGRFVIVKWKVMRKGERTRQMIVERAAPVFNMHGYFGASMSDLIRETRIGKGGIYNHFESKEALAVEAFEFAVELVRERFRKALSGQERAADRLMAIIAVFRSVIDDPPLPGGCPVLNTAIEADDTNPPLRDRARQVMDEWQELIIRVVRKGIRMGELRPEIDPEALATVVTATLEGAVMLSKLYGDPIHMRRAVDHLTVYVRSLLS
jgi:TetR/AcrR family transcriptional regulator, transcriptional repressor for nem operon